MPNPDELQRFTGLDYVIIDSKVVASAKWVLEEKPNQDEDYTYVGVYPGPPSVIEQQCFADLLVHYNFSKAFAAPSDTDPKIQCKTPYY